jgi:hypothetical protein
MILCVLLQYKTKWIKIYLHLLPFSFKNMVICPGTLAHSCNPSHEVGIWMTVV